MDANKDGLVEMATSELSTALPSNGRSLVDVDINACGITPAGFTYQLDFNVPDHAASCTYPITMDVGTHTLTVWPDGGDPPQTLVLSPKQQIVVGMGDSYGSGETRSDKGSWYDANCRRGAWSAQTRSALALEESDPYTSIIFVHVACSGATVNEGLLGPYEEPPGEKPVKLSQVKRIKDLLGGRKIDAVLLSIGGNDIGFGNVIKTCAVYEDCALTKKRGLNKAANPVKKTLHKETQGKLKKLPDLLDKVAECVTLGGYCEATDWKGGNLGVSPSKVLHTAYPDIATTSNKDIPRVSAGNGDWYCSGALRGLGGITPREFEWAREVVQMGQDGTKFKVVKDLGFDEKVKITEPGLNRLVSAGPFTSIGGAYELFHGHGYCAPKKDRWVVTATEARTQLSAPFHPNKVGYQEWSTVIAPALIDAIGP